MPDFDETKGYYEAADGWWEYWGPVVDGIFSWETAWPERGGFGGKFAGDVSIDVTMAKSAAKHKKMYMMGLSPLQYKNAYKAHVYRQGDLNLPKRMINILQMDPQPDFVQFQTWNDGPEAHYIGTLWPEQNTDHDPNMYANQDQWDHTGWQSLLASFIKAYKSGSSTTAMAPADGSDIAGAMWYRTELTDVECPFDGKAAFYSKPDGFDDTVNYLYWSIILNPSLGSGYTAVVSGKEEHTAHLSPGINYGYGAGDIVAGEQIIKVKDPNGNVVYTATGGMCVSDGCPNYIYNGNYQVVPFKKGDAKPTCQAWPSVCVEGTGDGDLAELCAWTCHYNVCHSPCKCTSNEEIFNKPPLANSSLGGSAIFAEDGVDDLCQYACSRSYCPSNVCKQTGIDADHTCSFPADEAASWSETGANLLVDNWISGSGNDDWLRKMDVAYNLGSGQSSLNCDDISTNSCPSPDSTCAKWPNPAFWYVRALSANVNSYFKYAHEALQDASIRNLAMVDQMIIDFKMSIPDHDLLKEILGTIAGGKSHSHHQQTSRPMLVHASM